MTDPTSVVASQEFATSWRNALHGNGTKDAWALARSRPGGLHDVIAGIFKAINADYIIDLAAGDLTYTRMLALFGAKRIRAYDINPTLLGIGEEDWTRTPPVADRTVELTTGVLDIGQRWHLDIEPARAIFCGSAFMFMSEPQVTATLESVPEHLTPDGRFIPSFTAWEQGVGALRRKRAHCRLFGPEPDGGDPQPFWFQRLGSEASSPPEFFRPRWWWNKKFAATGWKIEEHRALYVPAHDTSLDRQDKFGPGMPDYVVYVLKR